jgi:hypothetical protein
MTLPPPMFGTSVLRGVAVLCTAFLLGTAAHPAQAGINAWTSHGPPGGSVRALAIAPSAPATLYAGTLGAGVFKSTDAGVTWNAANAGQTSVAFFRGGTSGSSCDSLTKCRSKA